MVGMCGKIHGMTRALSTLHSSMGDVGGVEDARGRSRVAKMQARR